ncbi:putative multidrug resistance protein A [Caenibius tardaugens NBRC 16725]|uniref:Putative multidrug resistance protein A n=1 Tax=Caenibius tardaugens NBRC 16725 TaxID=1219035 RepID=U2YJW8_9SPHN|nr:EmrA/EmrK family multidrug efflux transporter periplasmic adaptor subunit [Caenibius tardaugens]AZI34977.1 EmrA/EmrK family multidrug efflux transporter periplasmic adaptor subunit [Caenibius tardaugens NBRC 16725]GAD48527.1 putative multidrug resistance protein A [Caenibius tardaugens NBRC 16725]
MAEAAPPQATQAPAETEQELAIKARRQEQRRTWLLRVLGVVMVIGIAWALWYVLIGRNQVSTDNAYVNAEMAQVTPLMSAQAIEVRVRDTDSVKRGDILVRLDDSDAKIAVAQAEADLADARRRFRQASATTSSLASQVKAREATIAQMRADLDKARIDLQRREALASSGAVSGEELTQARAAYATARAAVAQAESTRAAAIGEFNASEALVRGSSEDTDPGVLAAKARLDSARLDLDRAIIRAPVDGVVTKRQVQVGQRVAQGTPIMTIVPVGSVYIDANFKERQLRRVKVGMPATVTSDLYGGSVVYHGKVAGLSGGTGASMSMIPAQNATGNWIKVVQRLPVRIELDPKELAKHPLRVGLSTEVEIDLSGN